MSRIIGYFIFILTFSAISAQETQYITETDISYYENIVNKGDAYINKICKLDIYYPIYEKNFPTIVWFHGGGLMNGNKKILEELKNNGVAVVAVDYRLSPKVNSPKYVEDAAAGVAWVFKNINNYGGDSSLIFVSGHSAGGYLTLMLGLDKKWLGNYNIDANRIAGLIPLSGQTTTHSAIRNERGIEAKKRIIDDMAPIFHVRDDAPPVLLITGDRDLDINARYEENLFLWRLMLGTGHKDTKIYEIGGYGHNITFPASKLIFKEVNRIMELRTK